MSRFERGDEVVHRVDGRKGTVTNAPFEAECWVRWDDAREGEASTYTTDAMLRLTIEKPNEAGGYASGGATGIIPLLADNSYIIPRWTRLENGGITLKTRVESNYEEANDAVKHPSHYTSDPSGVECIQITRHRNFAIGNAIKYLWRAGLKTVEGRTAIEKQVEDLKKAVFYIEDEIKRLEQGT